MFLCRILNLYLLAINKITGIDSITVVLIVISLKRFSCVMRLSIELADILLAWNQGH